MRIVVRFLAVAFAVTALGVVAPGGSAKQPGIHDQISYHGWTSEADFASGTSEGAVSVAVGDGAITFGTAAETIAYDDPFDSTTQTTAYDYDRWTSPTYAPTFALTELVSSWTADTPAGTWIQVEMQGTTTAGTPTKGYVMGRWRAQKPSGAGGRL